MNLATLRRFSSVALLTSVLCSLPAATATAAAKEGVRGGTSAVVPAASTGFPRLLYKVDFEPPLHQAGAPPAIGVGSAPRYTPTRLRYGDPLVVESSDAQQGQVLELAPAIQAYDQVSFELASNLGGGGFSVQYPTYHFELTVTITNPGTDSSGFAILLDAPMAQQIDFAADGVITALASWDPDPGIEGYRAEIGRFDVGVPTRVAIDLDTIAGRWEISLGRERVLSERFPASCPADFAGQCIRNLRLNTTGSMRALIDDVVVMDHELELKTQIRREEDANTVVPHSRMLFEVLLMGSESIDISRIDLNSLGLGAAKAGVWKIVRQHDANQDGFEDLIVQFRANETGVGTRAEKLCLEGEIDAVPFYSCDVIETPITRRRRR